MDESFLFENVIPIYCIYQFLGQVPWLKDVFLLLPQKGPIETFHKLNEHGATNSGPALSAGEAAADASLLMASSIETTSQALTTLFRYALADPAILRRLREEIDSAFSDCDNYADVSSKDTHRTPFLNACIQEALRIMPPAPAGTVDSVYLTNVIVADHALQGLPRTTGSDGATVLGEFIPPDTTIHVPTFALQRDAANFADPGLFIPTRWLPSETVSSPHNNLAYVPFGAGFGACVGRQLAQQNIRFLISFFDTSVRRSH
ncbi:hypothetical protein H0H81_000338 [Sphagnurus paluster]|uniref:Cytochrome P450 n=1 Tax=Sphagnurus paluster TaxID=117069 RepID=A0A9P7GP62_9AGAR|nr:hypothetical protein H0H81_000338 [Sphagnurus paluster]